MKKRIFCLSLAVLILLSCSCSSAPKEELYNYEVTEEPFESMEVIGTSLNYKMHVNEQDLFEDSELVFIGMPLDTFTDGQVRYFNRDAKEVDKDSDEILYRYTVRDIKVIEMIKGDSTLETVRVADEAVVEEIQDGNKIIVGLPSDCSIAKKNVKYVYYLMPALPEEMDFYFCQYDGGLANIDGLDERVNASNWRLSETKARFSEQFVKYDRSAELEAK
ncbi:MAG: hypothetical protein IJ408_02270 [Clostridia bacterium]|nr:hypothetical protein [Clostridia bacterium]